MKKKAFDIDWALEAIEEAVKPWPKAAMFELAEAGFNSPFEQLTACIISIRTYDEVTIPTARKLFERAPTPAQMSKLTAKEIDALIHSCTFHERKAGQDSKRHHALDDVYGSTWLTSGLGSVIAINGDPGDPTVELVADS